MRQRIVVAICALGNTSAPPPAREAEQRPLPRGDDMLAELDRALAATGLRLDFDSGRNFTHPCTFCGRSDEPRELVTLGRYFTGGELTRPVCAVCRPVADARAKQPPPGDRGGER